MRACPTAILGPTNTGKTHLAVERMCAHSSGMIGFPLRLLARFEHPDRAAASRAEHAIKQLTPARKRALCADHENGNGNEGG